jgi:hypothetical protein
MTYGLLLMLAGFQTPAPTTPAQIAFENFKKLAGRWEGAEKDGRKIAYDIEVIAGGSAVMESSAYDAHPGEKMVTMYHLDQGKLILTHYCVAGNQPRLEATEISPDGKKLLFTFRDATNIKSRDQGHMDKVKVDISKPERMSSQWTWYQAGKESWMEAFEFARVKRAPAPASVEAVASCCPK